jgi:hypothetical protein
MTGIETGFVIFGVMLALMLIRVPIGYCDVYRRLLRLFVPHGWKL